MTTRSLVAHTRKLAVTWALLGALLTIPFGLAAYHAFQLLNAGSDLAATTQAVVAGHRSQILSGDIRAVELQVRKALNLQERETAVFLDEKKRRWVPGFDPIKLKECASVTGLCRDWLSHTVRRYQPIYFDDQQRTLWGYLYVEKEPQTNWIAAFGVVSVFIFGMLLQIAGMYSSVNRTMTKLSTTIEHWSQRICTHPKRAFASNRAPFSEFDQIESALGKLTTEIAQLESIARKEGALQTLRGMGHDILNPVARMKRILGIIEAENTDVLTLDRDLFISLQTNLKRLSEYAEQLKIMYKRDLGESIGETNRTNVSEEVRRLITELKFDPEVVDRKILIDGEIQEECFASIAPSSFGRMVENLCANAIQASKNQGQVSIRVSADTDTVHISVKDSGNGIPAHIQNKIFESGFTTKTNKGTGLGLFVVKQVCDQYRGKIELCSDAGAGSVFTISLPKTGADNDLQNSAS